MILKKIQGTHMDPADWIETYIIEVEFLNDEDKTQYLCMSSEFDEDHQCMVEDLAITNESIFDIAEVAFNFPADNRKEYYSAKEAAIEAYGPYRKGLLPVDMGTSEYKKIIQFAQMALIHAGSSEKLNEFFKVYKDKAIDDVELIEQPDWTAFIEKNIEDIEKECYKDDLGNKDEKFIEDFENFVNTLKQKAESETEDKMRLEYSSLLDNTLTAIDDKGKEALYSGIKEYEELYGSL